MADDRIQVLVDIPVQAHDDGDGQWVARLPDLPGVVGMGATAREARAACEDKAAQAIVDLLGQRDRTAPPPTADRVAMTHDRTDAEPVADRITARAMDILRSRSKPDAQTHAALRGAILSELQEQGS